MRFLERVASIVAGALVALILAEMLLVFRPAQPISMWFLTGSARVLDPELIYLSPRHLRPSYYRVNALLPTVVTLGDSFTDGFPVHGSRSYPSVLQRKLARRGYPVNVVNLGFGDSGPDQHLRLFIREALPRVQPDVVIWQFYANDVWDNSTKAIYGIGRGGLEPIPASGNWLYQRQWFFNHTPLPRFVKLNSRIYGYALKSFEHRTLAQVPEGYVADPQRWALEKIRLELAEMETLAKARDFRAYYTIVPPQSSYGDSRHCSGVVDKESLDRAHADLRNVVASMARYIDIDFPADRATAPCKRFYVDVTRDLIALGNRHLNEAGYRFMARRIAQRLADDGAVGSLHDHQ